MEAVILTGFGEKPNSCRWVKKSSKTNESAYTLRIEKSSHPKCIGTTFKEPREELSISLKQLSIPEANSRTQPGKLDPSCWDFGIKQIIQGILKILER